MRLTITQEQWEELSQEQKTAWCDEYEELHENPYLDHMSPNIGQMIEFLGEDFAVVSAAMISWQSAGKEWGDDFLCDALWTACKNKLNQT